ncbi:MAG: hypothetical protein CMC45_02685 [Flavobacteriaceae bacterium]|nr:hypothetical protein [Flavobacteriaceae bacterium]
MRIFLILLLIYSCNNNTTLPKQKAFFAPKLETPTYKNSNLDCNYNLLINSKSSINNFNNCNYEIYYKDLNSKIFINQINFSSTIDELKNMFDQKVLENSKFSNQIIESEYIDLDKNIYSRLYSFIGDSPANIQFYLTDMSNNFITGSLYFETKPNYDSLYPYINYIRNDIRKMVDSFEWTNE